MNWEAAAVMLTVLSLVVVAATAYLRQFVSNKIFELMAQLQDKFVPRREYDLHSAHVEEQLAQLRTELQRKVTKP